MQWKVWNFLVSHPEKTSREICTALRGYLHSVSSLLVQGERRGIYLAVEQYDVHAKRKLKRYSVAPKWKDRFPEAREAPLKNKAGVSQPPSSGIFVTTEPLAFTAENLESEEVPAKRPGQLMLAKIRQLPFEEVVYLRQEINRLFQG